jgi:hypothetical protein
MRPRVFVVMPFGVKEARPASQPTGGSPGSPRVDVDFDAVYEKLVAPALIEAGCVPFRADQEPGAGDIRTDMYYELVTADVVLADISVLNPNVFYELGIRHGVAPRGVLMIHGGWSKRPFDVAPDRTFDYDGGLFVSGGTEEAPNPGGRMAAEVTKLGAILKNALEADPQTIGSPVYKELAGLRPVDWTAIRTARAKYFGEVFADWKRRVETAKLEGWPGDILTLAEEAPTRYHRIQLLWQAADALCSMHRFDAALPVLDDLIALDPAHRNALTRRGLVLGRLDKVNEAKVHMQAVAEQFRHDTEAHGILGRVYKDLWRLQWKDLPALEARQRRAAETSRYLVEAARIYDQAARRKFDYYTGINVVSLVRLLAFLKEATGEEPADPKISDVDDLVAVVRFAAQNAFASAEPGSGQDGVWAAATLGELELVEGNAARAKTHYGEAANSPETTYFAVASMLDQVHLFENLGFRLEAVAPIERLLEERLAALEGTIRGLRKSEPRFAKVVLASGHMVDAPGRAEERFPARKEDAIKERIAAQLAKWGIGVGDLAICGGARGTDILFAERCAERGAEVWLFLALAESELLEESVRLPNTDWEDRFFLLRDHPKVRVFSQPDRLRSPPKGASPFARNNAWMINTARVEVADTRNLYALIVWDEKPRGDGPGGTADFAARVRALGGRRADPINPLEL